MDLPEGRNQEMMDERQQRWPVIIAPKPDLPGLLSFVGVYTPDKREASFELIDVHPAHQGKGIGKAATRYFEEWAAARGALTVVGESWTSARTFWEERGYTVSARRNTDGRYPIKKLLVPENVFRKERPTAKARAESSDLAARRAAWHHANEDWIGPVAGGQCIVGGLFNRAVVTIEAVSDEGSHVRVLVPGANGEKKIVRTTGVYPPPLNHPLVPAESREARNASEETEPVATVDITSYLPTQTSQTAAHESAVLGMDGC